MNQSKSVRQDMIVATHGMFKGMSDLSALIFPCVYASFFRLAILVVL